MCTGSLQALLRNSVGRRHQAISNVWFRHLARGLVCRPPVVPLLAADVVAGLHWWRGNVSMLLGGFYVGSFLLAALCRLALKRQACCLVLALQDKPWELGEDGAWPSVPRTKLRRDTLDDARSGKGGGKRESREPSVLGSRLKITGFTLPVTQDSK